MPNTLGTRLPQSSHQENTTEYLSMPDGTRHYISGRQNDAAFYHSPHPINDAKALQYKVNRNERTGHIVMPLLGSGMDDWFCDAVAKGTLQGTGLTPIVDGELSNVIRRIQMMVYDWVISLKSSFDSPMRRTANLLAQAEDGMGAKKFMSYMTGSIMTMNSGFFFSYLPLDKPLEEWDDFGAQLIPVRDDEGIIDNEFWLQVPSRKFTQNKGLWALDNLQCDPTGNPDWPYRVRKELSDGTSIWVLVSSFHGNQALGELGSKSYDLAGWWPSPLYIYFGEMGVMNAMVVEYNFEGFFNAPPEGMVLLVNADTNDQLANIVEEQMLQREQQNSLYFPGTMWVSIRNKDGKVFFVPFKKPSEGFSQEEFIKLKQRRLALAFGLGLNFVTLEIGVGAVHQAAVADMIGEVTGIAYIRNKAEHIFNHFVASPRVIVAVTIPSSAARVQEADTLKKVSDAAKTLQDAGAGMSPNQLKLFVEKFTGQVIPEDHDERSADDSMIGEDIPDRDEEE